MVITIEIPITEKINKLYYKLNLKTCVTCTYNIKAQYVHLIVKIKAKTCLLKKKTEKTQRHSRLQGKQIISCKKEAISTEIPMLYGLK